MNDLIGFKSHIGSLTLNIKTFSRVQSRRKNKSLPPFGVIKEPKSGVDPSKCYADRQAQNDNS